MGRKNEPMLPMPAVSDSGPFIHLALLQGLDLLPRYFHPLLTLPQVYEEVVTQGRDRLVRQSLQPRVSVVMFT
jgi:hypothetical protein